MNLNRLEAKAGIKTGKWRDKQLRANCVQIKKTCGEATYKSLIIKWAHLGLNQGPPDYESGALTS